MNQGQQAYDNILQYFDHQTKEFDTYIDSARNTLDPEDIHQFRLNLKRIKGLCNLTEYCTESQFITRDHFKPFRKIFKPAGRLRDVHVKLEIVTALETDMDRPFSAIKSALNKIGEKPVPKLKNRIRKHETASFLTLRSAINEAMSQVPEEIFVSRSITWIKNGLEELTTLSQQEHSAEVLHQLRATLKELFYMIDMLNQYVNCNITITGSTEYLKDLARCIGKWHDHHILISRLNSFVDSCTDKRRRIYIESTTLLNVLPRKNDIAFKELHDALSESDLFLLSY